MAAIGQQQDRLFVRMQGVLEGCGRLGAEDGAGDAGRTHVDHPEVEVGGVRCGLGRWVVSLPQAAGERCLKLPLGDAQRPGDPLGDESGPVQLFLVVAPGLRRRAGRDPLHPLACNRQGRGQDRFVGDADRRRRLGHSIQIDLRRTGAMAGAMLGGVDGEGIADRMAAITAFASLT